MPRTKPARAFYPQAVHFLRKSIAYTDNGVVLTVGTIPAGSLILKPMSGVQVTTVFNAATTNTLNIGKDVTVGSAADADLYATLLALGTLAFVPLDEAIGFLVTEDTTITTTVVLTGTAATTGAGEVVIAYIPDMDG